MIYLPFPYSELLLLVTNLFLGTQKKMRLGNLYSYSPLLDVLVTLFKKDLFSYSHSDSAEVLLMMTHGS